MHKIICFKVGDKCQYNKTHKDNEVVEILEIQRSHCLILFPNGSKICTTLSRLYPLKTETK